MQNSDSVNKLEGQKETKLDDLNANNENLKSALDNEEQEIEKDNSSELINGKQTANSNYDNLHNKAKTVRSIPLKMENSNRTGLNIKKSKSETINLSNQTANLLIYKLDEEPFGASTNQLTKLDFKDLNNNENLKKTTTKLTDIILNTNLKQLENSPDTCYFQI